MPMSAKYMHTEFCIEEFVLLIKLLHVETTYEPYGASCTRGLMKPQALLITGSEASPRSCTDAGVQETSRHVLSACLCHQGLPPACSKLV